MTKSDLIKQVAEANKLPKVRSEAAVNRVFECIKEALRREERVEIRTLGCFEIRHYGSYEGRNPHTGAAVAVKPKRLPIFRANKTLKDLLNPSVTRTQDQLPAVDDGPRSKATLRIA
jgi:nucleoid DNA-binding protein